MSWTGGQPAQRTRSPSHPGQSPPEITTHQGAPRLPISPPAALMFPSVSYDAFGAAAAGASRPSADQQRVPTAEVMLNPPARAAAGGSTSSAPPAAAAAAYPGMRYGSYGGAPAMAPGALDARARDQYVQPPPMQPAQGPHPHWQQQAYQAPLQPGQKLPGSHAHAHSMSGGSAASAFAAAATKPDMMMGVAPGAYIPAGMYPPGPGAHAGAPRRPIWTPRKAPNPFRTVFSPIACLLFLAYLTALGYYLYIRGTFTLAGLNQQYGYGVFIFVVELIGISAVIPYGALLVVYTASKGTRGLPIDDGKVILPKDKRFHVRVLVPCYKEALSVIENTVCAALEAELPPGVRRTIYLCDDGKDPEKRAFVDRLGPQVVYVSGRARQAGEINGKSANVNNCLKNVIYGEIADQPDQIPWTELVVVFDADMAAKKHFFLKVLEAMWNDETALCLTPQAFSNIKPKADLFNNINTQFWEYVLPGCDAWGYIACTGTNFCIRARALSTVGWFPEYTITEDYALSMELKMAGFKGRYLAEYLAVGEAPDEVRNVMRQRSRWTKGHMQIFFSKRCPLIQWRLPLVHKILYTNGTWAYFCTIFTTITFVFIPFNSIVFNLQPVLFTKPFVIAATAYLPINFLLMSYVRKPSHLKGMWYAQVSNHVLCFTYIKAVFNTLAAQCGFKAVSGFKSTDKTANGAVAAIKKQVSNAVNSMGRMGSAGGALPLAEDPAAPKRGAYVPGEHAVEAVQPRTHVVRAPQPPPGAIKNRRTCWLWVNAKTLEYSLDPIFLLLSLGISAAAITVGIYNAIAKKTFNFEVNSWEDFTQIFTTGRLDVYSLVPMLWALYNTVPPLLFFVYFLTKGRLLVVLSSLLHVVGFLASVAAIVCLWLWYAAQP